MDLRGIDLNLLLVFEAMAEHRSVTRAGEAIGLSQPAMSAALARLRALLDDPLFIKVGARMAPTDRAEALTEPVRRVLQTVRGEILLPGGFDPARSERTFTVITPDIGEMLFVPPLVARLATHAPGVRLNVISRPRTAAADALAAGDADLAIGYFPDLRGAAFFQQKLFDNRHVCMLRQDHPLAHSGALALGDYLALQHVVVHPDGREHVFEQYLARQGVVRNVVLELSHFMSLLPLIETSDLVATVPQDLAQICQRYARIRVLAAPIEAPDIPVHQFWHRRAHKDAACAWLRTQVQGLFGSR
ncbi:LysR family transcriptional regulator [Ideonella sp. TBM-1]|uniref:LysR family transcriptional regulator n=2 Tax=Ideonella livida TaxID=2707176 RepID=A0A7C9PF37_9BURK|nr:LysR family transcriptional regulator [Ideonella livida]